MKRVAAIAGTAALAVLGACHEGVGPGRCFEPNAAAYSYALNGDTNLVFHWPASYMPVRVYAEPAGALPTNVATGMALWAGAFRCNELSFIMSTDSTRADIIVRNPSFLPAVRAGAGALHADSVNACTGVTQFNTAGAALSGPMRSYLAPLSTDSAAVASCYHFVTAHELGHALGLLAHSPDTGDLMNVSPRRLALSEADRYTIQVLYHRATKLQPPPRR
jgi:predicted Zn-dependent protease